MPGSASKESSHSGLGEVKAWWTAVHAECPSATSPSAAAAPEGLNSGASTTHVNAHALGSMRPQRLPISRRAAPSSSREAVGSPAAKKTQSPGSAPTFSASPARSDSEMFFATGPPSVPSSAIVT